MVERIAQGDYESLVQRCAKSRLTSQDVSLVVRNYGREVISPPIDAYQNLDSVPIKNATVPTWSVRLPLWTKEEGWSDLTLELTIALGSGDPIVELDDIHVL
jgi:hypothetical protein